MENWLYYLEGEKKTKAKKKALTYTSQTLGLKMHTYWLNEI